MIFKHMFVQYNSFWHVFHGCWLYRDVYVG